ncbi:CLUMA_CG014040, isoform A [Clunio marinus]|uniref:non-specific serine/threonine protein kinase n=1 Tax=Clunio marinus TaxID=568069 RepID=A0A1J1IM13_9DIPT|nr:CLUMA_CG014040, isoform A [Clunio marinus]
MDFPKEFPILFMNFKILDLIGEGSFGKVFKAENKENDTFALKILRKKSRSNKELSTLRQEAIIHQNLKHPNIIQLFDSIETDKELVFVCEYAVSDLHKLLAKQGSLGEKRTQKFSCDIISALNYLHSHRILHRDLKPPNILLDVGDKAKLCDFGLARNMTLRTQVLTSIKGTPLYMAPEVLDCRGYGHQADLWSLGIIIYEMLTGETPFQAKNIMQLICLIQGSRINWPTFLSTSCISFLQGLLVNDPQKRMKWNEILNHKFVKEGILITTPEQGLPFTKCHDLKNEEHSDISFQNPSGTSKRYRKNENQTDMNDDSNLMSSRDSLKVNMNLQSDLEETDVDTFNNKSDSEEFETSGDATDQCEFSELMDFIGNQTNMMNLNSPQHYQIETPRIHNIEHFQPVIENSNMVMHRFMDVYPELQNFKMIPQNFAMGFSPNNFDPKTRTQNPKDSLISTQNEDNNMIYVPKFISASEISKKSDKEGFSDGFVSDISSIPIETEEWLQFLLKAIQEVFDGDLDIYSQEKMMTMIIALLRNPKINIKLIDLVIQIICLPFTIEMPQSLHEEIDKLYLQMKLVPNLVYASKLICSRKLTTTSFDAESFLKKEENIKLNSDELKTVSGIYDLVVFLVYTNETFLHTLCDALSILNVNHMLRSLIAYSHKGPERLTASILSLLCVILKELPENSILVEKIIFHDDIDLTKLIKHENKKVKLQTLTLVRLLGRFCCFSLQNYLKQDFKKALFNLSQDSNIPVREQAVKIIGEFEGFINFE